MYDENELYNEMVNTVKTTGKTAISLIEQLNKLNEDAKTPDLLTTTNADFVFTGQSTDLRYFENCNDMPISLIENISDENLKNAVKNEFNKAVLSGKIEINNQSGLISITAKGREFINLPEFKQAASANLSSVIQQQSQTMQFALTGTVQDLNFFNFADSLDLKDVISNPDKQAVQNILGNLGKMKESGFITVSNSVVKITDKGKNLLNSDLFKLASKGTADKAVGAVGAVPGAIVIAVKKVAETAASLIKK